MSIHNEILKEAERNNREEDLPDALFDQIKTICNNKIESKFLNELLERLEDYEPFADVGCGNESYSTADVQRVVDKIVLVRRGWLSGNFDKVVLSWWENLRMLGYKINIY